MKVQACTSGCNLACWPLTELAEKIWPSAVSIAPAEFGLTLEGRTLDALSAALVAACSNVFEATLTC